MTVNERIIAAVSRMELPYAPDVYTGAADTYITFNYDSAAVLYAGNRPETERVLIQVHYACPLKADSVAARHRLKVYLWQEFEAWPDETDATDGDGQHWVMELDAAQPIEYT